mgnify:CR=1 FL=1
MHILLTRPLEDSHELILKFKTLGHKVSHIPLINIEGKNYEQLKKVSKNISMISLDIKKIEQKKSLLMWCIEHDNMQFIELKEQDGICLNNL